MPASVRQEVAVGSCSSAPANCLASVQLVSQVLPLLVLEMSAWMAVSKEVLRRRGVFTSVDALKTAITAWIDARNADPKPFVWTAKAGAIIAKHARARKTLAAVSGGCK